MSIVASSDQTMDYVSIKLKRFSLLSGQALITVYPIFSCLQSVCGMMIHKSTGADKKKRPALLQGKAGRFVYKTNQESGFPRIKFIFSVLDLIVFS